MHEVVQPEGQSQTAYTRLSLRYYSTLLSYLYNYPIFLNLLHLSPVLYNQCYLNLSFSLGRIAEILSRNYRKRQEVSNL